nr:Q5KPI0-CRYNJ expressed protein [Naematelia aurantialba]
MSVGCVMRASTADVYGHPDGEMADAASGPGIKLRDPRDLTSSRLQSELYLSAAYQALRLCSFMANPTLHTIQAQILINVYLIHSERAADAWAQSGSLIRQAIGMGLHVDPTHHDARISMRDAEVKRRVWWTIAGLDSLLCLAFGRPSAINFYTTNLPQDRPDENLSDAPGSAQLLLPPSNVLRNETTELTFHAAYWQMTIPSYELLDRVFHVDREYSRSAIYGWFSPSPDNGSASGSGSGSGSGSERGNGSRRGSASRNGNGRASGHGRGGASLVDDSQHTYDGALRLADDIHQWYSHVPRGMRFEPEEDVALHRTRSKLQTNQVLMLCFKTFLLVMALHRPYLRADPLAYPESTEICAKAAHMLLTAYRAASTAKASIFYSWWTVSYRAFHACAVCAFLAIRQPGTDLATRCIADVRGAISVLEDRIKVKDWVAAHPVQADLCNGMIRLERLATAAMEQRTTSSHSSGTADSNRLSAHWTPSSESQDHPSFPLPHGTPLSEIRGFPELPNAASPVASQASPALNALQMSPLPMPLPLGGLGFTAAEQPGRDGLGGPEAMALPQFWASMFGIKIEDGAQGPRPTSMH